MTFINTRSLKTLFPRRNVVLLALPLLFILASSIAAQPAADGKTDPRVAKALKENNTEYDVSSRDGIYRVTYATTGKRTQLALISSDTETINEMETRVVFSFATISKTPPTQQVANMLLQENMERIGIWAVQKLGDGSFAIVSLLHIPAASSGKQLEDALMSVAMMADDLENRLTKKDVN